MSSKVEFENQKLKQAIILAGGLGERLKPLTYKTPKPLVSINGKPFILYLIERLILQNITEILILTGFKSDEFLFLKNQFGNKINLKIIETPVSYQTGSRILNASEFIHDHFLLLYGDNYWPFNIKLLAKNYFNSKKIGQIVIYQNDDRYSLSNVSISDNYIINCYDKSRKIPNLQFVDIGFGIFSRKVIEFLDLKINESFEKQVYEKLVEKKQLIGFPTAHRYYSLTNLDRLGPLETVLSDRKIIMIDRDGVLNKKAKRGEYITSWNDWVWNKGAISFLKACKNKNYRIIIISNQAAIGRKIATQPEIDKLHTEMLRFLDSKNANCIEHIYICPHHWEDNCDCRKPKIGLFTRAQKDYHIDLTKYIFIGDTDSDMNAAKSVGMDFFLVDPNSNIFSQLKKYLI